MDRTFDTFLCENLASIDEKLGFFVNLNSVVREHAKDTARIWTFRSSAFACRLFVWEVYQARLIGFDLRRL